MPVFLKADFAQSNVSEKCTTHMYNFTWGSSIFDLPLGITKNFSKKQLRPAPKAMVRIACHGHIFFHLWSLWQQQSLTKLLTCHLWWRQGHHFSQPFVEIAFCFVCLLCLYILFVYCLLFWQWRNLIMVGKAVPCWYSIKATHLQLRVQPQAWTYCHFLLMIKIIIEIVVPGSQGTFFLCVYI